MSEKDTIAAQVRRDSPLHNRFEEYEEDRRFESRSEAVRALLRAGLDKHEEEKEEHREEAQTVTPFEQWCQEKFQTWAGASLLAGAAFTALFALFLIQFAEIASIPAFWVSAGMFAALTAFIALLVASAVVWTLLRTGYARALSARFADEGEVPA